MRFALGVVLAIAACDRDVSFPPSGGEWPARPVAPWTAEARLALTNSYDDTLAFVSRELPSPRLLDRVAVGTIPVELEGPHHLAFTPDGRWIFVGLSNYVPGSGSGPHGAHGTGTVPGSLLKIDARTFARAGEVQVDRNPGDVLATRDGRTVFLSHYDVLRYTAQMAKGLPEEQGYSKVAIVNTEGGMALQALVPVCPTAHGMALSSDEKTLYASCSQTDQVAVLDVAARTVKRVAVGAGQPPQYEPYALTRAGDGTVWISCAKSGELRVFDPAKGAMDPSRTVRLGGVPMFSAFLSDGKTLLAPHQGDDKISVVDTGAAKEVGTIPLPEKACLKVHQVIVTPDDRTAYAVCEGDHRMRAGTLVAIDVAARAVVGFVEVGLFPDSVALLPPVPAM